MYKTYTSPLTGVVQVVRLADNVFIQPHEEFPDYQAYLAWVAEGNEAEPWEPEQ